MFTEAIPWRGLKDEEKNAFMSSNVHDALLLLEDLLEALLEASPRGSPTDGLS